MEIRYAALESKCNDSYSLELDVTVAEKLVLVVSALFVVSILVVAGWSMAILLMGDNGGGPLAVIADICQIERVLS